MDIFTRRESEVRSYCRSFPAVFTEARGSTLVTEDGREILDFFAGAGALNYGHNHPRLKAALVEYLSADGVTHSLDLHTAAKRRFLERFEQVVLKPRGLDHKVMFPGPTGTNAVEAALKLARKATGRTSVISFTNGFHGMTLGSLAITGNQGKRDGAGVTLGDTQVMPFDGYLGDDVDTIDVIARLIDDRSSGFEAPAAFVLETVQAEGGVHPCSMEWLHRLQELAHRVGALLVVDDIQVGCGRTGPFFSFDGTDVVPDLICLSKSLSGYGLPLSVVLVRPEHDVFTPGEHNGTFRGHNPAFVTATEALSFWENDALKDHVTDLASHIDERLNKLARGRDAVVRGRGLIQGIAFDDPEIADKLSAACFERGLMIETAGPRGEVLKLLPPLVLTHDELDRGLDIIASTMDAVLGAQLKPVATTATDREVTA